MPPKKSITDKQITTALWRTENPNNIGYNAKTGKYTKFRDPNGTDWLIGPGLKIGSTIKDGEYTKEELNSIAAVHTRKSLASIGKSFNEKYGTTQTPTPWDTVSLAPKLLMNDARYRAGTLPQSSWPSLYDAVANGDWGRALTESRTKFQRNGTWYPDNDRVRRNAEAYFPGAFDVNYVKGSWDPVKVTRKKKETGGKTSLEDYQPVRGSYGNNMQDLNYALDFVGNIRRDLNDNLIRYDTDDYFAGSLPEIIYRQSDKDKQSQLNLRRSVPKSLRQQFYIPFSNIADYNNEPINNVIDRWHTVYRKSGNPTITRNKSLLQDLGFIGEHRANYNPIFNKMYSIDSYPDAVAEISHAYINNGNTDFLRFTQVPEGYDIPHTLEFNTHKIVEPAIRNYISKGTNIDSLIQKRKEKYYK